MAVKVLVCELIVSVCVYIHVVARTNSCKNMVLRGCGRLQGSISYFLATGSLLEFCTGVGMGPNPWVSRGNGVEKYVKPAVIVGMGTMLTGIPRAWVKLMRISRGRGTKSLIILH